MSEPDTMPPEAAVAATPRSWGRRVRAWLLPPALVLLVIAVLLGALGAAAVWLLRSDSGTRWLLGHLPGVQAEGVHGALLGEHFEADRLRVAWAGGRQSVTIEGLAGAGLQWQWRPLTGVWIGLDAARLAARRVSVDSGPGAASTAPASPLKTLRFPFSLDVAALQVDELAIGQLPPLRGIRAHLAYGTGDGARVDDLQLEWDRLRLQAGGRIALDAPFALALRARAAPLQDVDSFGATLQADGTLQRLTVDATLRGSARPGHAAPSADVRATLLPFAAWPLAALSAQTQALDLAALSSAAPQTRLSGRAEVGSSAVDAPITATLQIENTLPGRWDEGRLPVRRLALDVQGRADRRDRVELKEFDVQLGGGQAAGRWRGQGSWQGDELRIETTLTDVQPQWLDHRAAAIALSGPLALTLHGLPSPDPGAAATATPLSAELKASLSGRMAGAPQPVRLVLEGTADASRIELRQLQALAGGATLKGSATAVHGADGSWQLATRGKLAEFDPRPWWPGEPGSAWQTSTNSISADWQFDLRLPAPRPGASNTVLLQRLGGKGSLRVHDSRVAGVPVALDLTLDQTPAQGVPDKLHAELQLAGNRFVIDASGDAGGDGAADRWSADIDAGALAALAPLLRLQPALATWAPRAGSARGHVAARGRWPQISSEGDIQVTRFDAPAGAVADARATWNLPLGGSAEAPLALQLQLGDARYGEQHADRLGAEVSGTLGAHKVSIDGTFPFGPPPIVEQLLGTAAPPVASAAGAKGAKGAKVATHVQLLGAGAWQPAAAGGGRWNAEVTRLAAASRAGEGDGKAWLEARALRAELQFDAGGALMRLSADPGRVLFGDAGALRWDAISVDRLGAAANIELHAEVEPVAVAPLLARAEPTMGWSGDLKLGGRIDVRAGERFDADLVIERSSGDLHINDENGTQPLGLTQIRLALAAHDGSWVLSSDLKGRSLGELSGVLRVKTTPQQRWPDADAPLGGTIEARVDKLGAWGTWVPAGWRLSGQMLASVKVGGRFGAPEYTGSLTGTEIGVRNLLQGVNITQGDLSVALEGTRARIERLTLKGGDGTLKATGGADFGSAPNARLHFTAERFRLLGRLDRQLIVSGDADLGLSAEMLKLDGKIKVDEGLFDTSRGDAPSLDDDVAVNYTAPVDRAGEAAPPTPRRNIVVDLEVDLGTRLRVRGHGLDTALAGRLRITTPGGRLAVQGTVSTVGGTYAAYGQKLDIDRGIVAFSGTIDNPRLDILALRPNIDARVGVAITGNLLAPRVRLYADSDMSDMDKLSWLVLGREPIGLGRTDTALLQRAALALFSGEEEGPTDALLRNLGLDELSVRQSDGDTRETVITLGKQLSRRWYVGYERGVNASAGTFQLIYRIAQRFTLRAQGGADSSLDLIWIWRLDESPFRRMRKSADQPP